MFVFTLSEVHIFYGYILSGFLFRVAVFARGRALLEEKAM